MSYVSYSTYISCCLQRRIILVSGNVLFYFPPFVSNLYNIIRYIIISYLLHFLSRFQHFFNLWILILMWFQAGPRMCLGKDFAYRQMKLISMTLLHFFRFKLANEAENVTYRTMITLHIDNGLHLYAVPRLWEV